MKSTVSCILRFGVQIKAVRNTPVTFLNTFIVLRNLFVDLFLFIILREASLSIEKFHSRWIPNDIHLSRS